MKNLGLWLALSAGVLQAEEGIKPNLQGLAYPVLAAQARIQGTVRFIMREGSLEVSGHPLLIEAARNNLEIWNSGHVSKETMVDYEFVLKAPTFAQQFQLVDHYKKFHAVKKFFRLVTFRRTYTKSGVWERVDVCKDLPPPNMNYHFEVQEFPDKVHITVMVERTTPCLQPVSAIAE